LDRSRVGLRICESGGTIAKRVITGKLRRDPKEKLIDGLNADLNLEFEVVANYTKRIAQVEAFGDKGLAIRFEEILAEETDHAEELEQLGR